MPTYFTIMPSPLGVITLSSDGEILTGLTLDGHPPAGAIEDRKRMKRFELEVNEYLSGERKKFSFKVDQPGTPFQKQVWRELLRIPYGKTISYGELAERVGKPKAYRAAGTANGKNQIAIVIPCHRVIASGGKLGGYGGGLWRKEWLLNLESKS